MQTPTIEELLAIISELIERDLNREEQRISDAKIIAELNLKIASLETELARYRSPKNSGNSHKPPSTDIVLPRRNQSLREKSDKKPGGQHGHEGAYVKNEGSTQ